MSRGTLSSMFAKLGFILLVLAFGAVMFLAGLLAPAPLREPLQAAAQGIGLAAAPPAPPPAASPQPATAGTPAAAPLPHEALLLGAGPAEYTLQLGLFADADAAGPLAARMQAWGYATETIPVVDGGGNPWTALVVGSYGARDEAESARMRLARQLGAAPVVIVRPAPPAPSQTFP